MKKRLFFVFSFCVFASISVAFGSYIIKNFTINEVDGNVEINTNPDKENYKKVTFNNLTSTYGMAQTRAASESNYIYVKKGDYLTFDDLPVDITDSLIEWKKANGETVLSVLENGYSSGFQVNEDLDLYPSKIDVSAATSPTSNEIKKDDSNEDNDGNINISGNTVRIEEGTNDRNTTTEVVIDKPIFNGATVESTFKDQDGNEATEQNLKKTGDGDTTSYQHTMDQTIGLEDPAAEASDYKPNAGVTNATIGQSNVNNCVSRIKLSSDLYMSNTTLTIGARVGFCRWGSDSSQTNYQGFIVGSYNELDLCGKTLIVGSGSQLKVIGSLVDSIGGGKIVVENGGTLITTFVVEDAYHETSIPSSYSLGDAPIKSYRAPYLNTPIKFYKGSKFIGNMKIDFGSDGNTNMYLNPINLIGDSDEYMINTKACSTNSYIFREPVWDQTLIQNTRNEAGTKEDIFYQKFNYYFFDCASVIINNPVLSEFGISSASIKMLWDRCDFVLPNYFSFYLYNSNVKIKNNIIFMPGCYLYVDSNSSITLSANAEGRYSSGIEASLLPSEINKSDYYQSVGGLLFVHEKYNYNEMSKYKKANDSVDLKLFTGTINFWSYLNKNYPAYADVYGQIIFDTSTSLYKELYHLGGEINIYNLEDFASNVKSASSYIELYNSGFYGGPCHFEPPLISTNEAFFNASEYYGYPLVSEGNVLTSMTSGLGVIGLRSDFDSVNYSYDFDRGIVYGAGKKYMPIFMDREGTYNNWCNHLNKTRYERYYNLRPPSFHEVEDWRDEDNDDLRIVFNECSYDENTYIATYNSENFIYFRGGFFKYNGSQVDIYKFRNYSANTGDNTNSYMNVKLVKNDSYYGHDAWRLS